MICISHHRKILSVKYGLKLMSNVINISVNQYKISTIDIKFGLNGHYTIIKNKNVPYLFIYNKTNKRFNI